ncbi:DnaJ domain-containing protein [Fontivita pretiosa]|uniref:DnaJ domain-containing protein n=1 Tax=Fontivita pretiosa TaxID=2989684 RepID=UPI003D174095
MWLFGSQPRARAMRPRRHQRFNAESLTTPLGRVKDLSESGVCISGRGRTELRKGQLIPVKLATPQGQLSFLGRVAWVRQRKGEFDAGIELLDVKPHVAARLKQLGEFGFVPDAQWSQAAIPDEAALNQPGGRAARVDPWQVLGVPPDSTLEQVHRAYRKLARRLHPDVNKAADAAAQFQQVTAAYRELERRLRPDPNALLEREASSCSAFSGK